MKYVSLWAKNSETLVDVKEIQLEVTFYGELSQSFLYGLSSANRVASGSGTVDTQAIVQEVLQELSKWTGESS